MTQITEQIAPGLRLQIGPRRIEDGCVVLCREEQAEFWGIYASTGDELEPGVRMFEHVVDVTDNLEAFHTYNQIKKALELKS